MRERAHVGPCPPAPSSQPPHPGTGCSFLILSTCCHAGSEGLALSAGMELRWATSPHPVACRRQLTSCPFLPRVESPCMSPAFLPEAAQSCGHSGGDADI